MVFYFLIAIVALLLAYMVFEAKSVEVTHVESSKGNEGLKIIQLSDIHIGKLLVSWQRIGEAIRKENPDFIVMTGDYIESKRHRSLFLSFLEKTVSGYRTYICFGNHDHVAFKNDAEGFEEFKRDIGKLGIIILENTSVCISKRNKKYNLIGIADVRDNLHDVAEAFKNADKNAEFNIGISHNPDVVFEIPYGSLQYLLCGHFHGGQIWMPFGIEFAVLRKEQLCRKGIIKGLHQVKGIKLYISRGLGNVCFPLRFRSKPEITVLYL